MVCSTRLVGAVAAQSAKLIGLALGPLGALTAQLVGLHVPRGAGMLSLMIGRGEPDLDQRLRSRDGVFARIV
jgi:hypothetical protein